MFKTIMVFVIAWCITFVFTPVCLKLAPKIGAIDIPKDNRRVHKQPIPRLGGIAIFLGVMMVILFMVPMTKQTIGILISGTLITLIGVLDDIYHLSAKKKLFFQIVCALILFYSGIRINYIGHPFKEGYVFFPGLVSCIITVIWIVGITNTINLIDGLDGLAAGITAIASFSMAYIAYLNDRPEVALITLAIAGGTLGFLPYNFNPAKIFMGDGGSLFLGLMLATVSIIGPMKGAAAIATVMPVLVLGLPIFDTAFAIYRRLLNGKSIMEADKGHIHHRILSKGMNQKKTVIILYALSGILGVSAILVNKNMILETTVLIILTSALIYVFTRMDDSEIGEKNEQ